MKFIPFVLILCLALHAVCEPTELHELFDLPTDAEREDLYQRKDAPPGTFSFYASVRRKRDNAHICAGTLISPHYVLTSATCVDPDEEGHHVKKVIVDIGTHSIASPENAERTKSTKKSWYKPEYCMQVERIIPHEKYSNGGEGRPPYDPKYDIALLKLKKASKLCWAQLPLAESDCCDDEDYLNVGLGRTESEYSAHARNLEMAALPYMPHKQCAAYFKKKE